MQHKLISGDNHIDLTYCPPDLWSSQAPAKWKQLAPRVEERNDGLHWFVDDQDRGMWNGVGPGFLPVHQGLVRPYRRDEGRSASSGTSYPGAKPRPTTPELRLADLDRDGLDAEIIYGCLMINDLIDDARAARLGQRALQRLGRRLRQALRSQPRLPARHHPQHRPDRGRGRGPALRQDGAARAAISPSSA